LTEIDVCGLVAKKIFPMDKVNRLATDYI